MLDLYLAHAAAAAELHHKRLRRRRLILESPTAPPLGNPGDLRDEWWAWHLENPHVYDRIEEKALEMAKTGRKRYSVWPIVGHLRFQRDLTTTGNGFKICNNYQALYARLFMLIHPQHEGFFAVKEMKR